MYTTPPTDEDGADRFIESVVKGDRGWMASCGGRPEVNGSAKAAALTCLDFRIPPLEMLGQPSQK